MTEQDRKDLLIRWYEDAWVEGVRSTALYALEILPEINQ